MNAHGDASMAGSAAGGHPAERMYEYHVWANRRVFDHLKTLPKGVVHQEIASVFPSIHAVLRHMYRVDALWLDVMRERSTEEIMAAVQRLEAELAGLPLEELEARVDALAGDYRSFFREVGDLDRPVAAEHPRLGRLETRVSELVRHVCNHGTYHRGNITAMLRQMGHPGVPTDYVFFLMASGARQP